MPRPQHLATSTGLYWVVEDDGKAMFEKESMMQVFYRILIVTACLFAAIASYAFGVPAGGAVFLVVGLAFETAFWVGLFGRKSVRAHGKA